MDEFDLEVAPLKPLVTEAEEPARTSPSAPLPAPFAQRLRPRVRLLRAGGILGVLLLAVTVLVVVTPGAPSALIGIVRGPTPSAPPIPTLALKGYDALAVEDQVPWGTLLIDGHPGPSLAPAQPVTSRSLPALPTFSLSRGSHQLEYRADPFPPLHCTLSVPAMPQDTCPIDPQVIDYLVSTGPGTRLLDLQSTINRLPAAQAAALTGAVQQTLDAAAAAAQDPLAPGDHYLGADGQVAVARDVLAATPTYILGRDTLGFATGSGLPCASLCASIGPLAQGSATDWWLGAPVDLIWRYETTNGRVVLANGLPGPATARQDVLIQVGARWSGGNGGTRGTGGAPAVVWVWVCGRARPSDLRGGRALPGCVARHPWAKHCPADRHVVSMARVVVPAGTRLSLRWRPHDRQPGKPDRHSSLGVVSLRRAAGSEL
jgi:hypothetical protein